MSKGLYLMLVVAVALISAVSTLALASGCESTVGSTTTTIVPVCTAGQTRNWQCLTDFRGQHDVCNQAQNGWDSVVDYCTVGSRCSAGQCVAACYEGSLDNYKCSGNSVLREYLKYDCTTTWNWVEDCPYGCSDGFCSPYQPNYDYDYDYNYNYYYNYCLYHDCSSYPYYPYVPYNGDQSICYATVDVDRLSDVCYGDNARAFVRIANQGGRSGQIALHTYVCDSDGSDCQEMACGGMINPLVYIGAGDRQVLECTKRMDDYGYDIGNKYVKVIWSGCGNGPASYSSTFYLGDCEGGAGSGTCAEKTLNSYRCFGPYRQQEYQLSDCSTRWKNVEYCTGTCSNGRCFPGGGTLTTATTTTVVPGSGSSCGKYPLPSCGKPLIVLNGQYEAKAGEIKDLQFDIINSGETDAKFGLQFTGAASSWLFLPSSVNIGAGEKETVKGYVKVPFNATGSASFKVVAFTPAETDSSDSLVRITGVADRAYSGNATSQGKPIFGGPIFSGDLSSALFWLVILLILVALILLFFYLTRWSGRFWLSPIGGSSSKGSGRCEGGNCGDAERF
jgi:hypothetical protein